MNLSAFSSPDGMFNFLGLDAMAGLLETLGLNLERERDLLEDLLSEMLGQLGKEASAVVLEPEVSFPVALSFAPKLPFVISLEQETAGVDPLGLPKLVKDWGVPEVRQNYSLAKLTFYYHPNEEKALEKKQLVAEISDYCKHEGVPFMLEILLHSLGGEILEGNTRAEAQMTSVQEFRSSCNLLALEYAGDPLSCATLTAELDVPWIVTLSGEYSLAKEQLRTALENGARGFLAREVVWGDLSAKTQAESSKIDQITKLIGTACRDKLLELSRISNEIGKTMGG